jgi:hypothetical protein
MLPLAQTAAYGGPALDMMRNSPELLLVTLGMVMPVVDRLAVLETMVADEALATQSGHREPVSESLVPVHPTIP